MTAVQFNPFTPEAQADPYPLYRSLREADPVHHSELMDLWVLTRHEDVSFVLKDARFSADRRKSTNLLVAQARKMQEEGPFAQANTMLSADPPEHTRLRGLVSKAFTPRRIEEMRPHIQEIVDALLDDVQDREEFDLIEHLSYPLPVIVIAEMLGIPPENRAEFKRWSNDLVATMSGPGTSPDALERAQSSGLEMADYFKGVIAERRKEPRDDLLSAMIAAEERGEVLSEDELLASCMLLLAAGNETTTNLIGNGMLSLLRHEDQLDKLLGDPSLTESAVEEMLRYEGPVQATARTADADVEIDGHMIEKGKMLFVLLAAANRDPAAFPNPETFDITREDNNHIAFGNGLHFCLGAPLARMEAQIAFQTLFERRGKPRLVSDDVEWNGNFILRGLKRLPLAFG
ncbi:MAG: cytochrome P450 [Chloroflexi bacterium]|nr:cytochrome P450 [Chloroflexota bacterium]